MCTNKLETSCGVIAGISAVVMMVGMVALLASSYGAKKFQDLFTANATLPDVNPDYLNGLKFKTRICKGVSIASIVALGVGGVGFSVGMPGAGFRK